MLNILIIDDDADIRFGLKRIMSRCGHEVLEANSGDEGVFKLANEPVDVVFCDCRFPHGMTGEQTLAMIKAEFPQIKVVMMSCTMEYDAQQSFKQLGASDALQKPFFASECAATLSKLFPALKEAA
jgi:CheY-like chemotaxis protein